VLLCSVSQQKKTPDSEYKKTDEPQPDVKEAVVEEEEAAAATATAAAAAAAAANPEEQEGAAGWSSLPFSLDATTIYYVVI